MEKDQPSLGDSTQDSEKFKKGDYSVHIFIEESKGLLPVSDSRCFNPVISIKCFGKSKCTRKLKDVFTNHTSMWNEHIYFSQLAMTVDDLESSKILIEVLDSGSLKDSLIGCYEFDFTYIYFKPKHSIIHQWVILYNPFCGDMSIQRGLLKLGVNIIHENDKAEDLTAKSVSDSLIIPPQVQVRSIQLIIQIIQAWNLPKMDKVGTCDTYCLASFATSKLKTKIDTALEATMSSTWYQELWIPVCYPTIANKVNITIWDQDLTSDEMVGSLNFSWDSIEYEKSSSFVWANIYGAHDNLTNETALTMNSNTKSASNWRGRILLRLFKRETEKALLKIADINTEELKKHIQEQFETEDDYQINAQVFEAVNLPFETGQYSVMIKFSGKSITSKPVQADSGNCRWYENIKRAVIGVPPHSILPDIFVYLMYDGKPICYARMSPDQWDHPKPREKWIKFTPDMSIGVVKNSWEGGYVLIRIFVGPIECPDYDKKFWEGKFETALKSSQKTLVCHLFQCRNLPAADATGLADPYVKILCGRSHAGTDRQAKLEILNPLWYESFHLPVTISNIQTAPPVVVQVWDYDGGKVEDDDMMGFVIIPMSEVIENPTVAPRPKWYPLSLGTKDTQEGEILLSLMIVDKDPPALLIPPLKEVDIEIYALGFRDLKPALGWLPVNKAFLKVDVRAMQFPGEESLVRELMTQPNNPGANPNIGAVLKFKTKIPEDPLFCPNLSCTVHDFLLSGKSQPVLGTFNLALHQQYEKRLSEIRAKNAENLKLEQKRDISLIREDPIESESHSLLSSTQVVPLAQPEVIIKYSLPMSLSEAQTGVVVVMPQFKASGNSKLIEIPFEDANFLGLGYNRSAGDGKKHYRYLLDCTLEKSQMFGEPPFKIYKIRKGQIRGTANDSWFFSRKTLNNSENTYDEGGVFKGIVRINSKEEEGQQDTFEHMAKLLLVKTQVIVRVYIIDAINLEQLDINSASDPYLVIKLGKERVSDRENWQEDNSCPKFLKHFDLSATFPGDCTLKIQVWDYESLLSDKKIGTLKIDLEDRFFNETWNSLPQKPIEKGKLSVKSSKQAQGFIRYWVEIHPVLGLPAPWDLRSKPPEPFEMRLVIWRSEEVPNMDAEGVSDLYVVASVNDGEKRETDTHYRAQNGEASWNWRMKFRLLLDETSKCLLNLSLWDRDLLSANDAIGSTSIDLSQLALEAVRSGEKQTKVGSSDKWTQRALRKESEKFFVSFESTDSAGKIVNTGKVLISVEIIPQAKADACKNGEGRSEPNIEPTLPAPEGRIQLTLNPVKMMTQMVGPELKRKAMIWCCLIVCALLCVFMFPMILANGFSSVLFN